MLVFEGKFSTVKNGNGVLVHSWRVDNSKPKCWREGHEYKFNTELVKSRYLEVPYEE